MLLAILNFDANFIPKYTRIMKLLLYSLQISAEQLAALTQLVGKKPADISFALIENAADVEPDSQTWLEEFRAPLRNAGYQIEVIDLRNWRNQQEKLREKLASKDVIWLGGGNTFYLRWILKETGADNIIINLIKQGKVYAGWSAGAIVAGPTLQYVKAMDDPKAAPEIILDGLHLVDVIVVPHIDNKDFIESAAAMDQQLLQAGYATVPLADNQVFIGNGTERKII